MKPHKNTRLENTHFISYTRQFSHRLFYDPHSYSSHPKAKLHHYLSSKILHVLTYKNVWPVVVVAHKIWYCSDYVLSKFYITAAAAAVMSLCSTHSHTTTEQCYNLISREGKGDLLHFDWSDLCVKRHSQVV